MANPFGADTVDYGTMSGQSSTSDGDDAGFSSLKERAVNLVMGIKKATRTLHQDKCKLDTESDTEEFRRKLQRLLRDTLDKVQNCKSMFVRLNEMCKNSSDMDRRMAFRSLQQSLTSAVNGFQEISQDILRTMETIDPFRANKADPLTLSDTAELGEQADTARLVRGQQQQRQVLMVVDDASQLEARAERMGDLENDISTLNEIMGEIGRLVNEQGEQIDHIEGNVEDAYNEVNHGNQQLEKGVRLKKCSRKLTCIIITILGVIFVFILLIIIIVAVILNKPKPHN